MTRGGYHGGHEGLADRAVGRPLVLGVGLQAIGGYGHQVQFLRLQQIGGNRITKLQQTGGEHEVVRLQQTGRQQNFNLKDVNLKLRGSKYLKR